MRAPLQLIVVLLLAGLLAACSTTRLAYNQSHRLVSWQLGGYLDLDRSQKALLREEFLALRAWHRATQLPAYAQDLHALADDLEAKRFDADVLESVITRANAHTEVLVARALPHGVVLARSMRDDQLDAVDARLQEEIGEQLAEREAMSQAQWRSKIAEDMVDTLQNWAGSLNATQRARVDAWAQARQATPVMWRSRRQESQRAIFALLEARHTEDFEARVGHFIRQRGDDRSEDLREAAAADRALWIALMLDLEASLSERQRAHLVDALRGYANDAEVFAARAN